jgi:hypothetical protein
LVLKIENMKLQNTPRKKVYIKNMLASFPVLTNKLTPDNIYNNSAIEKNGNWDQFKESLITFLRNKESEYKTKSKSRSSGVPPSARPLPSARPPPSALFASARPSAKPTSTIAKPPSAIFKKSAPISNTLLQLSPSQIESYNTQEKYNNPDNWHTQTSGNMGENLKSYIHNTGLVVTPSEYMQIMNIQQEGGGSRRRRSSHRKRKGYRKSKRVRHTRRKQTRRHRHRRSRHRR